MRKHIKLAAAVFAAALVITGVCPVPMTGKAASSGSQDMYRLYNKNSGEHFYTANAGERDSLMNAGWSYEGIGWVAPASSDTPVYRLYNGSKTAGDHHYTMDKAERDMLVANGWQDEGIGWYSDDAKKVPLYREYNPNAKTGTHNYTTGQGEHASLVAAGWRDENVGWYALEGGREDNSVLSVGSYIKLGSYEQDNNTANGKEPIEWLVVGRRDGHTLLLSRYALDCKEYNEKIVDVTWETCTLRKWLNNDFYNTAFSSADKARIVTAHNENPDSYELWSQNNTGGAKGGNATDDNVFSLSWTEARDYFGGNISDKNQKLLCKPTAYARAKGAFNNYDETGYCWWWLQSPGSMQNRATFVNGKGKFGNLNVDFNVAGVRPVILID